MKKWKRVSAWILAVALCASMLCGTVSADEGELSVTLDRKTVYLAVGDSVQLNAVVGNGGSVTWQSLTWDVAQVDETGLVTGLSEGKTTVKATAGDGAASALCTVIVYMAFPSYSLRVGEKISLTASVSGSWASADPNIAEVDGSGTVTAPLLPAGASRTSVQTPSAPFFKEAQGLFRTASRISGRVKSHSQTGAAAAGSRQAPARRKSNSL